MPITADMYPYPAGSTGLDAHTEQAMRDGLRGFIAQAFARLATR
jgi:hypothetical protein